MLDGVKMEQLKERKRELGYTNEMVARLSGVPLGTVQKVFSGATASPRYETLQAIKKALFPGYFRESGTGHDADSGESGHTYRQVLEKRGQSDSRVGESSNLAYAMEDDSQGPYTVEDYNDLPEGVRAELIDGVLYDMATPTPVHQFVLGQVHSQVLDFQKKHGYSCIPFMAPLSVQLDCDDKTMVEPDLIVLCDRNKLQKGKIYGAPDFLMEILSPSTRKLDLIIKFNKYWNAGVREYWIVDPKNETVTVYCFDPMGPSTVYSFRDQIPVRISGGQLEIDMREISEQMKLLFPDE